MNLRGMNKAALSRIHLVGACLFLLACGNGLENGRFTALSDLSGQAEEFEAILTCGVDSVIQSCFSGGVSNSDTRFEIKNAGRFSMYDALSLHQLGKKGNDGYSLHIPLSKHYAIRAQNSSSDFLLNLKIIDASGTVRFQKSVGRYGLIEAEN